MISLMPRRAAARETIRSGGFVHRRNPLRCHVSQEFVQAATPDDHIVRRKYRAHLVVASFRIQELVPGQNVRALQQRDL